MSALRKGPAPSAKPHSAEIRLSISAGYFHGGDQITTGTEPPRPRLRANSASCVPNVKARFSAWETTFKREIYDPYHAGKVDNVKYGPWLLKCACSPSWRALKATIQEGGDRIPTDIRQAAAKAEPVWRNFVLDRRENPVRFHSTYFCWSRWQILPIKPFRSIFTFYIQRVGATGIWNDPARRCIFTFCMMCSIAVVGVVSAQTLRSWAERLRVRHGVLFERTATRFLKRLWVIVSRP